MLTRRRIGLAVTITLLACGGATQPSPPPPPPPGNNPPKCVDPQTGDLVQCAPTVRPAGGR